MYPGEEENDEDNLTLSKFESMLKTNKVFFFDSEEFERIILYYFDTGKTALAKKALKLGLEQHPKAIGLKLVQVEILIFENKLEIAEKLLDEIYAVDPQNEEVYIQIASIHSKKHNHQKAIENLKIALSYSDDIGEIYNMIGMEYVFMDEFAQAIDYFLRFAEEHPEDPASIFNLIHCYRLSDQIELAIDYLENYINRFPYSHIAWFELGRLYFEEKNYEKALTAYEYATYIDDNFFGAYIERGKSLEKLKRFEEALKIYSYAMTETDPNPYLLMRIGKCFKKMGNKTEALKYFNKTIEEDPLLDKGWYTIANFYYHEKDYNKALFYINKTIEIENTSDVYWKKYAQINRKLNNTEETEIGYRKAVQHGNLELNTWLYWIDALIHLGEYQSAIETLTEAENYFSKEPQIEYRFAGAYFIENDFEKGKLHFKQGMKLDFESIYILIDLFPTIWKKKYIENLIKEFKSK